MLKAKFRKCEEQRPVRRYCPSRPILKEPDKRSACIWVVRLAQQIAT